MGTVRWVELGGLLILLRLHTSLLYRRLIKGLDDDTSFNVCIAVTTATETPTRTWRSPATKRVVATLRSPLGCNDYKAGRSAYVHGSVSHVLLPAYTFNEAKLT